MNSEKDLSGLKFPFVLKAQVPIGGRGKAGGIKSAENLNDAKEKFSQIMGMDIKGFTVKKVYAEEKVEIKKELYLSITLDRTKRMPLIMISGEGGMDIESVPDDKIFKEWVKKDSPRWRSSPRWSKVSGRILYIADQWIAVQ